MKILNQGPKILSDLLRLRIFLQKMNFGTKRFILPSLLSIVAVSFEGLAMALLIPAIKGILQTDFQFVKDLFFFRNLEPLVPFLFKSDARIFSMLMLLLLGVFICKNVFRYFSSYVLTSRIREFSNALRKRIFTQYLSFGKAYFDKKNSGYLQQIIVVYTQQIAQELKQLHDFLTALFVIIVYFTIMMTISVTLTLFVLIVFPLLHFSSQWIIRKIKTTSVQYADSLNLLSKKLSNVLSCIMLIKAYSYEETEKNKFGQTSDKVMKFQLSIDKKQLLIPPLQEILVVIMLLLLVTVAGILIVNSSLQNIAGLAVFFLVLRRAMYNFGLFNTLQAAVASIQGPLAEIVRLYEDEKQKKYYISDGSIPFKGLEKQITINHLSFSYPSGAPILNDVSFTIEKNSMVALVGFTGSGKSTIANLLMRFYDCPRGSILIDGIDIQEFTHESLYRKIAFVSQSTQLFNDSVRENLLYGLDFEISHEKLEDALKRACLYDAVQKWPLGLDTEIGDHGIMLSGGERQRLAIARAILKDAELLIFDEATSSLDSNTEQLIQLAIEELIQNKTSLIIAHRLSTIEKANKAIVIEDGMVVEQGSISELLKARGPFYNFWSAQKLGQTWA